MELKMYRFKLVLIIIPIFLVPIFLNAQDTIRLASGEWAPYQSEKLKHAGVASRIITEAFALSRIKVEYGYFPWKRSYVLAQRGEWDGTFLWFDKKERREFFYISDPVMDVQYVFFHLKKVQFDWRNIDDLKGFIIGATLGYDYGKAFQKAEKERSIKVNRSYNDESNFKLLMNGKIQLFPCELDVGYEIIQKSFTKNEAEELTISPTPIKAAPHHLLLSKKIKQNKDRMAAFNNGLKKLMESGKVDQYLFESRQGKYRLDN